MESIFSTYSQGENRVTASMLAVLRSLSLDRIQRILGALVEQSEFQLVRFENQFSEGGDGVPDALIQSSIRILVETKTERNAINTAQIERHLDRVNQASETTVILLVLTPDDSKPIALERYEDANLVWSSFASLDQAINELMADPKEVVSDREAFLLRELQAMLEAEKLIPSANDVVVVAARTAWEEYNKLSAYICQPRRSFQQVSRIAFYSKGNIYPLVPLILETHEEVEMAKGVYTGQLGKLVDRLLDEGYRTEGKFKVFLLSSPNSDSTIKLANPIPNDKKSKSGKPTAFTMGQCYATSESLQKAKSTSEVRKE